MNFDLGINKYNHLQFLEKLTSFLRIPSKTDSDEREMTMSSRLAMSVTQTCIFMALALSP